MKYLLVTVFGSFFLLFGPVAAKAASTSWEISRIEAATRIFNELPGRIPAHILDNAKGIAVIPGELKAGFIFGAELGGGLIVSRLPDGKWSLPAFISLAGASFGFQIGGELRDIVLIFNRAGSVNFIENGRIKLGGDASVAAGPLGANFGVSTDTPEIYSYISSFGAFVGATVEGSVLTFDFDSNSDIYGISDPLRMEAKVIPEAARKFTCEVVRSTGAPAEVCS